MSPSSSNPIQIDPDRRVLVAMSGGVDSSVTACLLQEQGFDVVGVFMALTKKDGHSGCCSINDKRDARSVALKRGFKFMSVNYQEHFDSLKNYFLDEYDRGRTPNPCVKCNSEIKFGAFAVLADALRCRWIATGHYARVEAGRLLRGHDPNKDQAYALAMIDPAILPRLMLPVGAIDKSEVRDLARRYGLIVAEKPDSQDLCFVRDNFREVLKDAGRLTPGTFTTPDGRRVGSHSGFQQFTIGQRKGVTIGGPHTWRVVGIDSATATVTVSHDAADWHQTRIALDGLKWLAEVPAYPFEALVQVRYHGEVRPGTIVSTNEIVLHELMPCVTPGQLCVVYDGDRVLGGGFIRK